MISSKKFSSSVTIDMTGCLVNNLIAKPSWEIHIPSYSFCGPGTNLQKRFKRGDKGINESDEAYKIHDITYAQNKDIRSRNVGHKLLAEKAWNRVKAENSSIGEKVAAYAVADIMKAKSKLGMGGKTKQNPKQVLEKLLQQPKKI